MDAIEYVKRQAYADGLDAVKPPMQVWVASDAFSRAYVEAWTAGALAATAPTIPPSSLNVSATVTARAMA